MSSKNSEGVIESVKKHKKSGFIVVLLCVLACKIPVLFVLMGFGSLSALASVFPVPPIMQTFIMTVGIIGVLSVSSYLIYQVFKKAGA